MGACLCCFGKLKKEEDNETNWDHFPSEIPKNPSISASAPSLLETTKSPLPKYIRKRTTSCDGLPLTKLYPFFIRKTSNFVSSMPLLIKYDAPYPCRKIFSSSPNLRSDNQITLPQLSKSISSPKFQEYISDIGDGHILNNYPLNTCAEWVQDTNCMQANEGVTIVEEGTERPEE
ncbi:uncharacterized protein LOC124159878 [Ischnura elegans]|uniref:uncharacterized protein LOC124159878 n=1 Tax=Ischnura elegans TaxID=197161 RepID=UPI001ED8B793|nr:uncharacterized protein LOC124159878 [Ischnura elegans]